MTAIDSFLKQYEKEYDFYKQLARLAHDILETEIINRGIKAIVSNRAKRVDRLKEKLEKRNEKKKYRSKVAIEKDIVDLAGLRVALYFPSDRKVIDQVITDLFDVQSKKDFPEEPQKPKLNKRFSGYWASHYRVKLKKKDDIEDRFTSTVFEIQVASVLMQAWSEVEHDLAYKPFSGTLSEDELAILDEINGLVIAGEIALERLQKAITERTEKKDTITDKYEMTNLILNNLKGYDWNKLKIGNTQILNDYLNVVNKIQTTDLLNTIKNINVNLEESVSDQILSNFFLINYSNKENNIRKYLSKITPDKKRVSSFELFIKTWIVFEKAVTRLNLEHNKETKKNFIPNLSVLKYLDDFTAEEVDKIQQLRMIRNKLLHGYESMTDETLKLAYEKLIEFAKKAISKIKEKNVRAELTTELDSIK